MSLSELSKYIFAKIFGKPNSNCGVDEKERGRMMFNIKKAIYGLFKKPLVEVSLKYTLEEEIPEVGIPAQYFINALKDVDKWEACVIADEDGSIIRKLTNKGTADVVSWSWNSCNYEYPGKDWMNYSEREAVEKEASKTYQSITTAEKQSKDEASRKKMSKDYAEYSLK